MRWIRIREAKIDPELRETFERYGVATMQVMLTTTARFQHKEGHIMAEKVLESLLPWLTEQHDIADRKETWSLTMEAAITVFVLAELLGLGEPLRRFGHYLFFK
jgi:hypothetical protein